MAGKRYHRRQIVVDREFQGKMCLQVVGYVYLYFVLFAFLANLSAVKTVIFPSEDHETYIAAVDRLRIFGEAFVLPLVFTFLCMCLQGVFFSHRLAGPVYRFKQTLRSIRARDIARNIHIRRKDFFLDLCDEINATLTHLRGDMKRVLAVAENLRESGEALSGSDHLSEEDRERVEELLADTAALQDLVDSYHLDIPEAPETVEEHADQESPEVAVA